MKTHEGAESVIRRLRKRWEELPGEEKAWPLIPVYKSELEVLELLLDEHKQLLGDIKQLGDMIEHLGKHMDY